MYIVYSHVPNKSLKYHVDSSKATQTWFPVCGPTNDKNDQV